MVFPRVAANQVRAGGTARCVRGQMGGGGGGTFNIACLEWKKVKNEVFHGNLKLSFSKTRIIDSPFAKKNSLACSKVQLYVIFQTCGKSMQFYFKVCRSCIFKFLHSLVGGLHACLSAKMVAYTSSFSVTIVSFFTIDFVTSLNW